MDTVGTKHRVIKQPGKVVDGVRLPFGEMPAGVALNIGIFDLLTHAADIAHATGQAGAGVVQKAGAG
jgi:hypothetical protein